ncbi:unnamed protein product, partial [Prorocentrum cordatum]
VSRSSSRPSSRTCRRAPPTATGGGRATPAGCQRGPVGTTTSRWSAAACGAPLSSRSTASASGPTQAGAATASSRSSPPATAPPSRRRSGASRPTTGHAHASRRQNVEGLQVVHRGQFPERRVPLRAGHHELRLLRRRAAAGAG